MLALERVCDLVRRRSPRAGRRAGSSGSGARPGSRSRSLRVPIRRSPSQWPGTARSSTSGGRSEIITIPVSLPWPWRFDDCERAKRRRSPRPQVPGELSLERPPRLDVEGAVDRLVGDPHRLIVGVLEPEPARDLLGGVVLSKALRDERGEARGQSSSFVGRGRRARRRGLALCRVGAVAPPPAAAVDLTGDRRVGAPEASGRWRGPSARGRSRARSPRARRRLRQRSARRRSPAAGSLPLSPGSGSPSPGQGRAGARSRASLSPSARSSQIPSFVASLRP